MGNGLKKLILKWLDLDVLSSSRVKQLEAAIHAQNTVIYGLQNSGDLPKHLSPTNLELTLDRLATQAEHIETKINNIVAPNHAFMLTQLKSATTQIEYELAAIRAQLRQYDPQALTRVDKSNNNLRTKLADLTDRVGALEIAENARKLPPCGTVGNLDLLGQRGVYK